MGRFSNTIDRWVGRWSNAATLWPLLPSGVAAVVSYYLAKGAEWLDQYGAIAWWFAALIGFTLTALSIFVAALAWEKLIWARASRKWSGEIGNADPMASAYDKLRLRIVDLAHPHSRRITGKTFTDCDLVGPQNISFTGRGTMNHVTFSDCSFVIVADGPRQVPFVTWFIDCNFVRGSLSGCTIFVDQDMWDKGIATNVNGANLITYQRPNAKP